jgi:hypothetical protein
MLREYAAEGVRWLVALTIFMRMYCMRRCKRSKRFLVLEELWGDDDVARVAEPRT